MPRPARLLLPAALVVALTAPALEAQNKRKVTESYDSATLFSTHKAADVRVASPKGSHSTEWTYAQLGLSAGDEVDAFSDGTDFFPSPGPAAGGTLDCRDLFVEYTVDTASSGGAPLVSNECAGDGCASDTFGAWFSSGGAITHTHESDHLGVNQKPGETDLDALAWVTRRRYPVYFSVDPATASALGVSAADVLEVKSTTSGWTVKWKAADLGLDVHDDVDAVATDGKDVVFSLARGSTSLGAESPATLFEASGGTFAPWATPAQLDLDASKDNLNGVRITDPGDFAFIDPTQVAPDGVPWDTLLIDGVEGSTPRRVYGKVGVPIVLSATPMAPPGALGVFAFATLGCPCDAHAWSSPLVPWPFAFDPLAGGFPMLSLPPGASLPLAVPIPIEFSLQALVVTQTLSLERSNLLTCTID